MNEESTSKSDVARPKETQSKETQTRSGETRSNTPPAKLTQGDPPRRDYGDRTEDASRKSHSSKTDDKRDQAGTSRPGKTEETEEDPSKHDKGPHMDPTMSFDSKSERPYSVPQGQQPQGQQKKHGEQPQKAPQKAQTKGAGTECDTSASPAAKPDTSRIQGGGVSGVGGA